MSAARVTVLDSSVLERLRTAQLRDALDDADPHALLATSPGARNRLRASPAVPDGLPILLVGGGTGGRSSADDRPDVHRFSDVDVLVATTDAELAAIPAMVTEESAESASEASIDRTTETYVFTDRLSLSVRPTELSTTLEGFEAYREAIDRGSQTAGCEPPICTHLSTALPADYYRERNGLRLRGASPAGDDELDVSVGTGSAEPTLLTLALGPEGTVGTRTLGPDSLGLRAVHGVGRERASALRQAGIATRDALASADAARLADLDGVGRGTASRLCERARNHRDGEVLRRGDDALPGPEPVFVDVETDGLSPSIAWLVGVLDREGEERYVSFLARDPDEPGEALAAFCSWYFANADGRPIVAYNGYSFDFSVIEEQIERHCPEYLEDWQRAWTFDPYYWAVTERNAVLPGRTNKLEDVAAALGYEPVSEVDDGKRDGEKRDGDDGCESGAGEDAADDRAASDSPAKPLTGAEVGRIYSHWIRDRTPAAEPDWERLEAYCEDDVRALAYVYDALADADRREVSTATAGSTGERTTQGSLGDF